MLAFTAPGTEEDFRRRVAEAFTGKSLSIRRIITYSEHVTWTWDVFYDPVPDERGGVMFVSFAAVDVSAQRQRDDVMRLLAAGLSQTADGVLIASAAGDYPVVYANDAVVRMTGYERSDFIGKNCRFLHGGDAHQDGLAEVRRALAEGTSCTALVRNYRKDGTRFDNQLTIAPIREGERVTHFIGVQRDVTSERELEARLVAAERMEALGRLASGVAHDMNNLLMSMLTNSELIGEETPGSEASKRALDEIRDTVGRARAFTAQLLAFAKPHDPEVGLVEVGGHIGGMRSLLRSLLPADIELVLEAPSELVWANVAAHHLEQLIVNLVVNARDAMPTGGRLEIVVRATDAIPGVAAAPAVRVDVRDTGVGMDAATAARVFEPFFTTKSEGRGNGLGLATCFGIARRYGGHIEVTSKPRSGTTFTFYLPRSQVSPSRPPPPPEPQGPAPVFPNARVLLVEDEEGVRFALARGLRRRGYEVIEAATGAIAISLLQRQSIDVLVTDLTIPGTAGATVSSLARELQPRAVQILMSGDADHAARHQEDAAFLEKPFALDALVAAIADRLAAR